jgi:hypothetical protein
MLTGKCFRLTRAVLGLEKLQGKRCATTIPEGALIRILGPAPEDQRMVEVLWLGQHLAMFLIDIEERGEQVNTAAA